MTTRLVELIPASVTKVNCPNLWFVRPNLWFVRPNLWFVRGTLRAAVSVQSLFDRRLRKWTDARARSRRDLPHALQSHFLGVVARSASGSPTVFPIALRVSTSLLFRYSFRIKSASFESTRPSSTAFTRIWNSISLDANVSSETRFIGNQFGVTQSTTPFPFLMVLNPTKVHSHSVFSPATRKCVPPAMPPKTNAPAGE